MSDITDLPLFSGLAAEQAPAGPRKSRRKRQPRRGARPAQAGSCLIALPLSRNRQVVRRLVDLFKATAPGSNRSAQFRRDVLMPLASQRLALGFTAAQVDAELLTLEESMVRVILGDDRHEGSAA